MGEKIDFDNVVNAKVKKKSKSNDGAPKSLMIIIILVLVGSILFNMFTYRIREDEVAFIKSLGNITRVMVSDDLLAIDQQNRKIELDLEEGRSESQFSDINVVTKKGLGFKIPFYHTVETYTGKLLTYISQEETINTRDKRQFDITMFAQWNISHPGLFYVSFRTIQAANGRLDDLVYPFIIRGINRLDADPFLNDKDALNAMLEEALAGLNAVVAPYGIEVKDIEIFRTLLPESNIQSTYDKMRADREAVAQDIRSQAQEQYNNRVSDADFEAIQLEAQSILEAQRIYGQADAETIRIYAKAFTIDPEFFEFWRSMEAYTNSIDAKTTLILDNSNPFLKYFTNNSTDNSTDNSTTDSTND